jgi:monofunctional glycosyltransferase
MGTGALSDEDMFKNVGPPDSGKDSSDKKAAPQSGGVPLVFGAPEESAAPPPEPAPEKKAKSSKPPKSAKSEPRRKGIGARIVVFAFKFVAAFVALSILWVLAYRVLPVPGTILMAQRAIEGQNVRRTPVSLSKISPHLVRAVIAAEDSTFCKHDGFDFDAINMALENNERGKKVRGGSTISQQTAKNVFLWPGRTIVRKAFEAYYTLLIETFWPKGRIMEAYLNSIEFGNGYFGAEAAARGYFRKSAKDLTSRQAAALAAVLPSPNKWKVVNSGPYVSRRIGTIQKRMSVVRRDGLADCVIVQK